jgi:hypothetical protein
MTRPLRLTSQRASAMQLPKMNRFPPTPVPPAPMAGTLGSSVEPLFCWCLLGDSSSGDKDV